MKKIIEVDTGEVKTGDSSTLLVVNAIGSCIAIMGFDPERKTGGIAHIMLPGKAPDGTETPATRYVYNAFEELVSQLKHAGAQKERLAFCIAGGGNVLQRPDDLICQNNIDSVTACITEAGFPIAAQSVGGRARRRLRFDVGKGSVFCAIGDTPESILYNYFSGVIEETL